MVKCLMENNADSPSVSSLRAMPGGASQPPPQEKRPHGPNSPCYPTGSAPITQRSTLYSYFLNALFLRAKLVDEFEYACSLLGFEGMKSSGWSPEVESTRVVQEIHRFASLPLSPHTHIRIHISPRHEYAACNCT